MIKAAARRDQIIALAKSGVAPAEIAKKLKVTLRYVKATLRGPAPPPDLSRLSQTDRLEAAMLRWLEVCEKSQLKVLELVASGKPATALAVQAGIASQRAVELLDRLDVGRGLPEELPEDDDEARRVIRRAWWTSARNGSSNAMVRLATSYGIRAQRQQAVKVEFERPGHQNDQAPEAPTSSGGDPREQ